MKDRLLVAAAVVALAGCSGTSSKPAQPSAAVASATPTPKPTPNASRPIKAELNERLDKEKVVYHAGCRDEEKASCKDPSRRCAKGIGKVILAAAKKSKTPLAIEWEAPRETWEKNEGVLDHYWFVFADGSGTYFYLLPSPDDVTTDCGNGQYCGWHKENFPKGSLITGGKKAAVTLTPHGGKPIVDLDFCPPPPPGNGQ